MTKDIVRRIRYTAVSVFWSLLQGKKKFCLGLVDRIVAFMDFRQATIGFSFIASHPRIVVSLPSLGLLDIVHITARSLVLSWLAVYYIYPYL